MKIDDLVNLKKKESELSESEKLTELDSVRGKQGQKRFFYLKPFQEPPEEPDKQVARNKVVSPFIPVVLPKSVKGPKTPVGPKSPKGVKPATNQKAGKVTGIQKPQSIKQTGPKVVTTVKKDDKSTKKVPNKRQGYPWAKPKVEPTPKIEPIPPKEDKEKKPKPQKDKKSRIRPNFAEIERRVRDAAKKAKRKKEEDALKKKKAADTKKKKEDLKKKKAADTKKKKREKQKEIEKKKREKKKREKKKQDTTTKKKKKVGGKLPQKWWEKPPAPNAPTGPVPDEVKIPVETPAEKKKRIEKQKEIEKSKPNKTTKKIPAKTKVAHTIKGGDTLGNIAKANKTSVKELMRLNPDIKSPNRIFVGDKINLPPKPGVITTPPTSVPLGQIQTEPVKPLKQARVIDLVKKHNPGHKLITTNYNLMPADETEYRRVANRFGLASKPADYTKRHLVKNAIDKLAKKGISKGGKYIVAASVPYIGWALNIGFLAADTLEAAQTATRIAGGHYTTQANANTHRNMALQKLSMTLSDPDMSDDKKIREIEYLLSQQVVGDNERENPQVMLHPTTGIRKNVTSPDIWNAEFDDTGHQISFSNGKMNPGAYTQGDIRKQENTLKSKYNKMPKDHVDAIKYKKQINILRNAREDAPADRKTAIKNYAYMILMMQRAQSKPSTITNSALMQGIMIVEKKLI